MKTIRTHLLLFMLVLVLSGLTAFPIQTEIDFMIQHLSIFPTFFHEWLRQIHQSIHNSPDILFYGTDWLAFAHIIIALFFIPLYLHPIKYLINLKIAILACFLIFPLAFICGPIRHIPFFHQLIDCSFGIIGSAYLFFIYKKINQLKNHD